MCCVRQVMREVEHAEPGGGDRQGGAGDRLGQVELAEPGSGDQQGGAGAGDRLWPEVGCGCTCCVSSFFHETFSVKIDSAK